MVERTPPASLAEPRRNLARRDRTEDWDMRAATPPASPAGNCLNCGQPLSAHADRNGHTGTCRTFRTTVTYVIPPASPAEPGDTHAFKNFHRMLCERFGYTHDERDWRRDQVSLMEWIAKQIATPPAPAADGSDLSAKVRSEGSDLATPSAPAATDEEVARMVERLRARLFSYPAEGQRLELVALEAADLLLAVARERDDLERSWRMRGERCDEAETRATVAEAALEKAKEALRWYEDQMCEHGRHSELCGNLDENDCGGCRARAALAAMEAGDGL